MKRTIIFDAEPFCFGPISTTLNLIEYIRKQTDLGSLYELVLIGTGTSRQLAQASDLFDRIIECNTTNYDSLKKNASLIRDAELFVSTTNPHSINFLNQFHTKRIYIDTLFWLWGELRADFSKVDLYYIQRFFNIKEQLRKFSPYIPACCVVNPLIAYDLAMQPEEDLVLINLGGIDTIYHETSGFYDALISRISGSELLARHRIFVAGGGRTIEMLKSRYERENLTIGCLGKEQFKNLFTRCKKFIATPGLTSIHESHFLAKDVFFLPAQNYSQYLHMTYLRKMIKAVNGMHYEDFFPHTAIAEFLVEDAGIQLVKNLSAELIANQSAMDKLISSMEQFLGAPKQSFRLNEELDFSYSGIVDIAKGIDTLCAKEIECLSLV